MNKSVYDGSHRFSVTMKYFYASRNIGWDIYRQDELPHKISRYDKLSIESKHRKRWRQVYCCTRMNIVIWVVFS
jgi:hypothetical protein